MTTNWNNEEWMELEIAQHLRGIADTVEADAAAFRQHIEILRMIVSSAPWELELNIDAEFWNCLRQAQKMVTDQMNTDEKEICVPADWRKHIREFAEDSQQHLISRAAWKSIRNQVYGVALYANADYFTAYYDDAAELWNRADDTRPMFHVMVKSDPPHRTVIHALHLAAWVQHLVTHGIPVLILQRETDEE